MRSSALLPAIELFSFSSGSLDRPSETPPTPAHMRAQAGIGGDSDGRSGEPDEELNKSIASSDAFEAIELFKPSSSSPDRELWRLAEHHIDLLLHAD